MPAAYEHLQQLVYSKMQHTQDDGLRPQSLRPAGKGRVKSHNKEFEGSKDSKSWNFGALIMDERWNLCMKLSLAFLQ